MSRDPKLQTDTNFYNAKDSETKAKHHKTTDEFPKILAKLMEANQGSWAKAGPEKTIENFLKADILTTPKYRTDEKLGEALMSIRQDEAGLPLRRTFIGTSQ